MEIKELTIEERAERVYPFTYDDHGNLLDEEQCLYDRRVYIEGAKDQAKISDEYWVAKMGNYMKEAEKKRGELIEKALRETCRPCPYYRLEFCVKHPCRRYLNMKEALL